MGVRAPETGRIGLDGSDITAHHPKRRRALGIRNVPADRSAYGLAQSFRSATTMRQPGSEAVHSERWPGSLGARSGRRRPLH